VITPALAATGRQSKRLGLARLANHLYAQHIRTKRQHQLILLHGLRLDWTLATKFSGNGEHHTVYALEVLVPEKAPAITWFWVEQVYDFWLTFIRQPVVLMAIRLARWFP